MLVRTHTAGDKVWIGEGYLQILELPPGVRVKVGYEFPREISIHRDNPPVVVGLAMKVAAYRELIGAVGQWAASVKSAANPEERARECVSLQSAIDELHAAKCNRATVRDLERAVAVLLAAKALIGKAA